MQKRTMFGSRFLRAVGGYFKTTYIPMWIVIIICSVFSWMLVYSANYRWISESRSIYVQAIAIGLGMIGAVIISLMDYERLGELWWLVAVGCTALMLSLIVLGQRATGASAVSDNTGWIRIGSLSFQPAELLKVGFLITFPYHLSLVIKENKLNSIRQLIMLAGHMLFPVALNEIITRDTGTSLMFLIMTILILLASGIDWKIITGGVTLVVMSLPLLWQFLGHYQQERIRAVYNPKPGDEIDMLYQQLQGQMAMGGGKLTGQGWLRGTMIQNGLVPEASNDFIFTVAGEEFGFLGTALIVLLLVSLMVMCIKTALEARDDMGRFICIGFFSLIATQTVFNIGMCLMVLPVIGITLPFFSAGGSSSMCLYFGFGLVLSVYSRRGETKMKMIY